MWISDVSIRRPVLATMAIVSFMVLGVVSLTRLGIDLFPEVTFPFVMVTTVYPGASPEEAETLVSRPIEDAVSAINGVKRVESHSTESLSRVFIEFHLEVDEQAASAEVREKVASVRYRLPKEIEDPTVARFDISALPIITYAVGSTLPPVEARRMVEDDLKPILEQIEGVAAVDVNGGEVREIHVDLDPGRLEALHLPMSAIAESLAAENLNVPGGKVTSAGRDVSLRTRGEFTRADAIGDVILRSTGGSPVRLRDIARIEDGFEERTSTTRLDGRDAVSFAIRKQAGANTVEISRRVNQALQKVRPQFAALHITPVHDDAEFVLENIRDVRFNIIFGGVMAVLIIFVFMRDWRSTVISALALPTSVIATFFFMWLVGFTINMMTLMALSLVIGILIDDAVVVRENIYRHMEHGEDAMTAAHRGTAEIGLAVMATTFSILAVFLPVGFMTGIVGQFFKSFALTVAFAVAMSLLVAFTLDPMLSSRFVRYISPEERMRTRFGRILESWGRAYDRIDRLYHGLLGRAIRHPWAVVGIATVVFLGSLSSLAFIGTEFMPLEDRGEFDVLLDMPPGTSFDASVAAVADAERLILQRPDIRQVFSTVGTEGEVRRSVLRVKTTRKDERKYDIQVIKDDVRARLAAIPFADVKVARPPMFQGVPNEAPIQVYVRGDDLKELQRVSGEIMHAARRIPGAVDISTTLVGGQPEMVARVNRPFAADMGFSVGTVAMQLRGMVEGIVPTRLRDGSKEYDIRLRLAPEFRNDFARIARAPLYSPTGALVRTGDIVTLEPGVGPARIQREQRRRQARIGIDLQGRSLGDVTADVRHAIAKVQLPPNFEVGFQGDVELMQETAQGIMLALVLAVAFIYIVLASQFDSFAEPLIIMLSLPLAIVGALLLLLVTRQNLGMPAMIGIVMLMGLVTKNAILLVDYTNQARRKGMAVEEAILAAGPVRLRPVLMTTMAMILGMLPSALGRGQGGEFRGPMGLAVIGGLITSTGLTLVLVPCAYLLLARLMERVKVWRRAPSPAVRAAVRVTGVLFVLALLGAFVAAARAFAEPAQAPTSRGSSSARPSPSTVVLTFDQVLQMAMERNEALKISQERYRESQSRVTEARAAFLPSVDLHFLYTPAQDFPLIRIPAGIFGPEEQTFKAAFTRQNIVRIDFTQPIYTGGRLSTGYQIRAAQEDEARLELDRSRQSLRLQVVQAFYAALMNEQGVRVAEENVRLAEHHLSLARTRFEAGTAARLDVLKSEVDLAGARARLIRARSARDISLQTLRTVLSLPPQTPVSLEGTLEQVEAVPSRDALFAALSARPDIRAIGSQREMAARSITLANAEMRPMAAVTGNLQYQEDAFSTLLDTQNRSYQIGVALKIPLFAAPSALARRAAATAQVQQADHAVRAMLDSATLEVESAYSELEAAREIVATQLKAVELAREGLSIAEVSYENGIITAVELSDARLSLMQTEWDLTQAKYAQIVAAAKTKYAAGTL